MPFLITSTWLARPRLKVIVAGHLQNTRVKPDCVAMSFEHDGAEIIIQNGSRDATPRAECMHVAEQEVLYRLVKEELQPQGAAVRKREHKTGEAALCPADRDLSEVSPVCLGLFSRQGGQAEERLPCG